MPSRVLFVVIAACLAVAGIGLPAAQAAEQTAKQDRAQWRFTFHNGEWWYWLPTNRWVYWRDGHWNDYDPQTFTHRSVASAVRTGRVPSGNAGQMNRNSDVRPFYGHSQSELYQRPLRENSEVRPFYGHSLPDEVDEPGQGHRDNDPYYGNAISSGGD